jgi:hypothetical protein
MFKPLHSKKMKAPERLVSADWVPITPVPANAPAPPVLHPRHGAPQQTWAYRNEDGAILGYVLKFAGEKGAKSFAYLTWCRKQGTDQCSWQFKAWIKPRPLYGQEELARYPEHPVLVLEGEKCADAAGGILSKYVCVTSPGGSNSATAADWSSVIGRDVVIWPDADDAGHKYAEQVADMALQAGAKSVSVISPPPDAPRSWDAADAAAENWSAADMTSLIESATSYPAQPDCQPQSENPRTESKSNARKSLGLALVELVLGEAEVWHDKQGQVFVTLPRDGHLENWPIYSEWFRTYLNFLYQSELGAIAGGSTVKDIQNALAAQARHRGSLYQTYIRVGGGNGAIYLDLCNSDWQVVEVTTAGWRICDRCPIKFLRTASMQPLPEPIAGGSVNQLRRFANPANEPQFQLIVGWLIGALWAQGPYPNLAVSGEQGSGKTQLTLVLRALVDPNISPVRSISKSEQDLLISALNSHCLAFDNLSGMPLWLSDALCRLSTGAGFATRALYENTAETIIQASRPVILNGIPDLSSTPDLADRSLAVHLPRIETHNRQTEDEFWQEFELVYPKILGGLLDALSIALRNIGTIELADLPRMADFAKVVESAAPALGWPEGSFLDALKGNATDLSNIALDSDPVAMAIVNLLHISNGDFYGTATELLEKLNDQITDDIRKQRTWPNTAAKLGNRLRRIAPVLRAQGLSVETVKSGNRYISIRSDGSRSQAGDV